MVRGFKSVFKIKTIKRKKKMKKSIILLLMLFSLSLIAQDKKTPLVGGTATSTVNLEAEKVKARQALTSIQEYYDVSAEGTLYPKGTFPIKVDTTKVLVIYSTLDIVTGEDGTEFTSPKVLQKVMYVTNKSNSFTLRDYFDENKKPINKELIIWQTKEFPKK